MQLESLDSKTPDLRPSMRDPPEGMKMLSETDKTRREFLEVALGQDPDNTFVRYGLAMELAKSEPAAAWTHFDYLLRHHPEYSATYYQAGLFLINKGNFDEARRILAAGVEITGRQGNQHARAELQAALEDLEDR
jgi:tetratricopeptide (TPR) repeat protein